MKPTVVQHSQSLNVAVSEIARASARHGAKGYWLSLMLGVVTLLSSVFNKEIAATFRHDILGVRAFTLWEMLFIACTLLWIGTTILGLLCLPQPGRPRTFGVYSVGINAAVALLVVCTLV